jgi:small subunit ribosomal protein S19e
MANVFEVNASDLVKVASQRLHDRIKPPGYLAFVKSGSHRERPPQDPDFWFVRSASILRQVYINGPVGVSTLRTRYGTKKTHVMHRMHHAKAGGSVITDSFNALEKIGLIKKTKRGRIITPQGKSFLDKISNEIEKGKGKSAL